MPVTQSYTEAELADWILSPAVLGTVGGVLGWTTQADVQEIINRSLRAYGDGITTIDQATDVAKLEAVTAREAWRAAVANLVALVDFSVDGESVSRSDMFKAAQDALAEASADAASYGVSSSVVSVATVLPAGNPYDYSRLDREAELRWGA